MINEHKKGVKAMKYTAKSKPANPVAKHAGLTTISSAGAHYQGKDKKKAAKQGDVKHKKHAEMAEGDDPLQNRADYAAKHGQGQVYKKTYPGDKTGMTKAYAYDIKRAGPKGQLPKEGIDSAEYDDEAGMADNNLETLKRAVDGLDHLINAGDNLPEWCQEKIAVAKSMLVNVWDYMQSEEAMAEGLRDPKDNPCWKGYHPVGTKKKGGRTVPNCVPKEGKDWYEFRLKTILESKLNDK